jgi:hypothetical protein
MKPRTLSFHWLTIAVVLASATAAGCLEGASTDGVDPADPADPGRVSRPGDSDDELADAEPGEPVLQLADPGAPGALAIEAVARLAPEGGGRYGTAVAWDGEAFFVFGGYEGGRQRTENALAEVLRFVPGQAVAQRVGTLAGATWDAVAVADGGRILVFGGANPQGGVRDDVRAFDPASGTSVVVGQMPAGRSMAAAAATDLGVFVFGGTDGHGLEVLRHSPLGDLTSPYPALMPVATIGAQATVLDGVVYVVGGREAGTAVTSDGGPLDAVLRFDAAAGTFTEVARLPSGRGYGALVPHDGALYYFGGFAFGDSLDEIVRIDVEAGTAKVLDQRLPVGLSSVVGASDGRHAFLFGGNSVDAPSPYVLRVDLARLA